MPQPSKPTSEFGAPPVLPMAPPRPACDECGADLFDHCTVCGACPDELCNRVIRHERECDW